jgi:uncharacterized protein YqeY
MRRPGAAHRRKHGRRGFSQPPQAQQIRTGRCCPKDNAGFVVSVESIPHFTETTAMTLKQQLTEDMKTAMRGGDKHRLGVIRLMLAAIKQREVDERIELDDTQVLGVLEKMLKQRKDSVSQFDAAGRDDLSTIEREEMVVIETYLPAKLGDDEIDALITAAIADTGATSPRDMGKVVAAVKEKAAGRADMGVVSGRIKARLAG